MTTAQDSLQELLASAETSEDLRAIQELIEEEEKARPTPDRWLLATLGDVAEFFGCAEQTVKQWRSDRTNPMPGSPGKWPIKEIVRWREQKLKSSDLKEAKLKQEFERGEIELESARIELARTKAEIFDRADVERWAAIAMIETREMIMTIPEALATSSPPEMRETIRSESDRICRGTLTMLRRRLEDTEEIENTQIQPEKDEQ